MSTAICFAASRGVYVYDPITDDQINVSTGEKTNEVSLTTNCTYDFVRRMYCMPVDDTNTNYLYCNVFTGMITTNIVTLSFDDTSNITVYRDGEVVDPSTYSQLGVFGNYTVRNTKTDRELMTFTIMSTLSGSLHQYVVPSIFYITSLRINGETQLIQSNTVNFEEDGLYSLSYKCAKNEMSYTLTVQVDHTYPELVLNGVNEKMEANSPVSFGLLESGSTLVVTKDGEVVDTRMEIKESGDYIAKYTDAAGNTSTYYFTVNVFLDGGAWVFVGLAALVIGAAVGFVIYSRKNMRVR